jgi:hypothetical protein
MAARQAGDFRGIGRAAIAVRQEYA